MDTLVIDKAMAANQSHRPINSISASMWSECDRKMWLSLRRASPQWVEPDRLRSLDIYRSVKECAYHWLESSGVKIGAKDAYLKNSFDTTIGKIDGIAVIDGDFFLLKIEAVSDRRYKAWIKSGTPAESFAKMQLYMHHSAQLSAKGNQLTKALIVIINKNTGELHTEEEDYEKPYASLQTDRIEALIVSDAYPNPEPSFKCSFCDHQQVCEGKVLPEIDCRTCANVSVNNGVFECAHSYDGCETPCERHIMHPQLMEGMGFKMVNVDGSVPLVEYEHFAMAAPGAEHETKPVFNSYQMKKALDDGMLNDPDYMAIAKAFDAKPIDEPEGAVMEAQF